MNSVMQPKASQKAVPQASGDTGVRRVRSGELAMGNAQLGDSSSNSLLAKIAAELSRAPQAERDRFLQQIGASAPVRKRRNQQDNRKALDTVRSMGESIQDRDETVIQVPVYEAGKRVTYEIVFDGFVPIPPPAVIEKGPQAVELWVNRWLDGNITGTGSMDFDEEFKGLSNIMPGGSLGVSSVEQLAETAVE